MKFRVTVIGAKGFVGSAFARYLKRSDIELLEVTRENYSELAGTESNVVIEAACNSKKFLAERDPFYDFELSIAHRLRTLKDFPAEFHIHISSVDVYAQLSSPETTKETSSIDIKSSSHYGFNKFLAEQLVEHHAKRWLIFRLGGMVGKHLQKNPVFDILNKKPLFINQNSLYQFAPTDQVAQIAWSLFEKNIEGEIFNLCGEGLISPREIAEIAGREIVSSDESQNTEPRIVDVNIEKIKNLIALPQTRQSVCNFIKEWEMAYRAI